MCYGCNLHLLTADLKLNDRGLKWKKSEEYACRDSDFKNQNSLSNEKSIYQTKNFTSVHNWNRLQTTNVPKMVVFVFDRKENIVGKGENAGYQHFLLFPQSFQEASS